MTARAREALAPIVAAAVAFAWAAWWRPDPDAILFNTDVLYHLHRVQACLADFPRVTTIDSYSHAGAPYHLHWLGGFTLLLALAAKAVGAAHASVRDLALALGWVPPVLGAATAAVSALLARRCGARPAAALVTGLAVALSGDALTIFHHGQLDHHVAVPLGVALAAWGWQGRSLPAWTGGHLLMLALTPEASMVSTVLIVVAGSSECLARSWRAGQRFQRLPAFLLAPALAALAALVLTRALDPQPPPLASSDPFLFSIFHVTWLAVLGGSLAVAATLLERPLPAARRFQLLIGAGLVAASSMALVMLATGRAAQVVDRLLRTRRQQVGEELSLLRFMDAARDSHWGAWATLLVLGAAFTVPWLISAVRRRATALELHAAGLMMAGSGLALMELRHARGFAPLVALTLTFAGFETARVLARRPPFDTGLARALVAGALALIALPPFIDHAVEVRATLRARPSWPESVGALCDWMRTRLPPAGPRDRPPARAVFGPWEWGHHLNVLGEQPVIVDPFNHDESANEASWEAWLAETPDAFLEAITRRGGRHVVVTTAAGSILDLLQRTPYEIARRDPSVPGGIAYLPSLRRHFAFRLDERGGLLDESGRLMPLWFSPSAREMTVLDGDQLLVSRIPRARLYEIVPGARLEVTAPALAREMEASLDVRLGEDAAITLRRRVRVDPDGVARFPTALAAPLASDTIVVPGPYRLRFLDSSGAELPPEAGPLAAEVGEQDIRSGHLMRFAPAGSSPAP